MKAWSYNTNHLVLQLHDETNLFCKKKRKKKKENEEKKKTIKVRIEIFQEIKRERNLKAINCQKLLYTNQ